MDDQQFLAEQFEEHRTRLRAVAYRMLGSITEADDAVQEAWLRLSRSDADMIENLGGWLTTVVSRVCLNVLRSRTTRREDLMDLHLPDPIVTVEGTLDPEEEAMLADAVASRCSWCSRRSPRRSGWRSCCTTRSRCRSTRWPRCSAVPPRRPGSSPAAPGGACLRGATAPPDADLARQRAAVDAFFAAARAGDFEGLVALARPRRRRPVRRRAPTPTAFVGHERRRRGPRVRR